MSAWDILQRKVAGEKIVLVSNVPYSFVDIFLDTAEMVHDFIDLINVYICSTNQDIQRYYSLHPVKLVIILDELHTIFDSRDYQNRKIRDWMIPLTQCRKRDISIVGITQKPERVDSVFRNLADFTIVMQRLPWLFGSVVFTKATEYLNLGDIVDIKPDLADDNMSTEWRMESLAYMWSTIFYPLSDWFDLWARTSWTYHLLYDEIHVTKYVVGYPNPKAVLPTYDELVDLLLWDQWHPSAVYPDYLKNRQKKIEKKYWKNKSKNVTSSNYSPSYQWHYSSPLPKLDLWLHSLPQSGDW